MGLRLTWGFSTWGFVFVDDQIRHTKTRSLFLRAKPCGCTSWAHYCEDEHPGHVTQCCVISQFMKGLNLWETNYIFLEKRRWF